MTWGRRRLVPGSGGLAARIARPIVAGALACGTVLAMTAPAFGQPPSWSVVPSPNGTRSLLNEQRYRAVLQVVEEGASVTDVACRYGVARQTVHQWLRRYVNDGGLVGAGGPVAEAGLVPASDGRGGGGAGGRVAAGAPVLGLSRIVWQMARAGTVVGVPGAAAS